MLWLRAITCAAACGLAGGALAEDRPAPEYFLAAIIDTSTAQQLALNCPTVSINLPVVNQAAGEVLARLNQDGFDTASDTLGMIDPSEDLVARQRAFLAKHDLEGAGPDQVCAAARAEIVEGTVIGSYLMEVPG